MKLENQVCSLELAMKLKELGVEQFSALFAWAEVCSDNKTMKREYRVVKNTFQADIEFVAAFTVAELGEMLPDHLCPPPPADPDLLWCIKKSKKWAIKYFGYPAILDKTEANARAKMLIWLKKNGFMEQRDRTN